MATLLLLIIYIAFISLGLPDAMLGAAWPVMQADFAMPYSFAGVISMTISGGTIVSSIFSSRVLRRYGIGKVTAGSVGLTSVALLGFGLAPSLWWIILLALPLGIGAGAVDAGLNTFVAGHYESRHMSWLHSFWGLGALTGPLVLSALFARGISWRSGYLSIAAFQALLVVMLVFSIPLWNKVRRRGVMEGESKETLHRPLLYPLGLKGAKIALLAFLCYCGLEASMGLWGGSFLFRIKGLEPSRAAVWVSLFYASLTAGRFITGFLSYKVANRDLIRYGSLVILAGILLVLLPLPLPASLAGFLVIGLGCAPIYPCMLHETPSRFGADNASSIMGFQMAVAYIGSTFLPPAFGFIASVASLALLPVFLMAYVACMIAASELLQKNLSRASPT